MKKEICSSESTFPIYLISNEKDIFCTQNSLFVNIDLKTPEKVYNIDLFSHIFKSYVDILGKTGFGIGVLTNPIIEKRISCFSGISFGVNVALQKSSIPPLFSHIGFHVDTLPLKGNNNISPVAGIAVGSSQVVEVYRYRTLTDINDLTLSEINDEEIIPFYHILKE